MKNVKTMLEKTKEVLKNVPKSRDMSQVDFIKTYYEYFGVEKISDIKDDPANVLRKRRHIQNKMGLYTPTEETKEIREEEEVQHREMYGNL